MDTVADVGIVVAWFTVLAHNTTLAVRGVRHDGRPMRWGASATLLAGLLAAGAYLERASGGRIAVAKPLAPAGALLALAGAALHVQARGTIGRAWTPAIDPNASVLVESGPYAVVRHPLYVALAMLGAGTILGHPSLPTCAGGAGLLAGLAVKIHREEHALAVTFGARWDAYRARVPCVVPRVFRRT